MRIYVGFDFMCIFSPLRCCRFVRKLGKFFICTRIVFSLTMSVPQNVYRQMNTQYRILNEKLCGRNQALFDLGFYPGTS